MINEKVDIKENTILDISEELLSILLKDHSSNKNLIWATDNYLKNGKGYCFDDEIKIHQITGYNGFVIKPRTRKSKKEQEKRIKQKAEVFTPSWVCNCQNNIIDEAWFGYKNPFNKEKEMSWVSKKSKIRFKDRTWQDYVNDLRIELSCGEAPYLVSRYDTVTGHIIEVNNRIGLLDRKLRVINENVDNSEEWLEWVIKAYKSIYGFEWQGDSVLLARENLLYTFADNYLYKFSILPDEDKLKQIAEIISWNIFQMDGIKFVIPNSCKNDEVKQLTIFDNKEKEVGCYGCKKNNHHKHNGIYCKIMNWETNKKIKFITIMKGSRNNE